MYKKNEAVIVNLIGAPGSGKSTLTAGLFERLKSRGVDCEIALEYAKEKLWEGTLTQTPQLYIFATQEKRIRTVKDKVDVIITDAPHIHSFIYRSGEYDEFDALVKRTFFEQNNFNVLLFTPPKDRDYDPRGREQDKQGSDKIQWELKEICDSPDYINGGYMMINPFEEGDPPTKVADRLLDQWNIPVKQ